VDQPGGVRRGQSAPGLRERRRDLARRVRPAQPRGQRLSVDVLHRQEHAPIDLADLEHRDEVRVRDACERARLGDELVAPEIARLAVSVEPDRVLGYLRVPLGGSARRSLIATRRSSCGSCAARTTPVPPAPSWPSTR
jgi:hypothetical protein